MIRQKVGAVLGRLKDGGKRRSRQGSEQQAFPQVDVFSWRRGDGTINFGDHLADIITARVLAIRGYHPVEEVPKARRLFTIGSVLHFARSGDTVWGSGINGKIPAERHVFRHLDVRAVRGPRTANWLRERGIAVPEVYGDPALLLPHIFGKRFASRPMRKAVFVPNLNDLTSMQSPIPVVSPLRGWNHVIAQILEAEFVLASSLHGLIIAEAYGVPARYVRLTEKEALFKYEDYVLGSGRESLEFARSIPEALEMGGMPAIRWDPEPLLAAFPYDLWGETGNPPANRATASPRNNQQAVLTTAP